MGFGAGAFQPGLTVCRRVHCTKTTAPLHLPPQNNPQQQPDEIDTLFKLGQAEATSWAEEAGFIKKEAGMKPAASAAAAGAGSGGGGGGVSAAPAAAASVAGGGKGGGFGKSSGKGVHGGNGLKRLPQLVEVLMEGR
jgi:hypothetical protein